MAKLKHENNPLRIKADCFAFIRKQSNNGRVQFSCKVLNELSCHYCKFYKNVKEYENDIATYCDGKNYTPK